MTAVTKQEALEKADLLFKWFMDVRTEFPECQLTLVGSNNFNREVFFVGNITHGESWQISSPKTCPFFYCRYEQYTGGPYRGMSFLDMRVNYGGSGSSSEDWYKLSESDFKAKVRDGFKYCKEWFITKNI
jgi:hypothetical protein